MKKLSRRQFLALSASAVLLNQSGRGNTQEIANRVSSPQVYTSKDGLLDIDLTASYSRVNLGNQQAYLLNYNGQIPGPRLEAKPGDRVRIRFTNKLSQLSNLHYHGLHISPIGKADNVFLEIPSQESFIYEFTIPTNHPAGTFWYHPHLHGLVAEQVFGGLAGLLIVRGELDDIPDIKAAQEHFLVLKDFELDAQGRALNLSSSHMAQMTGREGRLLTVNGYINPTLFLPQGGLLRLRILNASAARYYRLTLEDHYLYLIATDGGSISEPVEVKELLLSPGERAEILVKGAREKGQYRLLNLPYDRGGMGMMGRGMMGRGMMGRGMMERNSFARNTEVLATVTYKGSVSPLPLPKKLIAIEALPKAQAVRRFELNHGMYPGQGMVFLINGHMFNANRIDTQVEFNTVEDWELINTGVMDHPFHLHTNYFQVISRNNQPVPYLAWKDTVNVPPGDIVRCRMRFADFVGKTLYHCHILDHEDLGMMGILDIAGSLRG